MDLQTVIAASMLPTTRTTVAAAFKELRHETGCGPSFLELLWAASGRSDVLGGGVIDELMASAARALDEAARLRLHVVTLDDTRYPPLLAATYSPPPVLWASGTVECLAKPAIAIVGSRAASPYALQVGFRLAADLAGRGMVVTSGLARGVDAAAHRGCLQGGGQTIAVQGCGLDRVYPAENDELAAEIARTGLVLTELGPGAPPLPEHFPQRNRIISGISLATVVVEASERSGSLITARFAMEQGRDVMAVPGSVLSGRNRGSHALLKDGARMVESADDILQELGWWTGVAALEPVKSQDDNALLGAMDPGESYGLDELAVATGLDSSRLLADLSELELSGKVIGTGGRFTRRG
jgi:DNA processing protein